MLNKTQIEEIRNQFPILKTKVYNNQSLIYFDNAATSQKPNRVINSLVSYYSNLNSNIHRGAHFLANKSTEAYENSRDLVARYINAKNNCEITFTKGTTESINLVAYSWGLKNIHEGEEILISGLEHHANIVPWQMVCKKKKAILKVIPILENGELGKYDNLITAKTKLIAISWVSNAMGTINPIKKIIDLAHSCNIPVLIDAAQALPHLSIDVQKLNVDFLVASAHKMYGPTGLGFLYAKQDILIEMDPFLYGGEMIKEVTFEETTFNELPFKFEAGTPNIADVIAYKEAFSFIEEIGIQNISEYENHLTTIATSLLIKIPRIQILGTSTTKSSVISFNVENIHPYDLGVLLDKQGIAIRTGHHCCQPLMKRFKIEGTCRASFAVYNTEEEIEIFVNALQKSINILS